MRKFQYKTAFVKMTQDPARFARNLENKLNSFADEGYDITSVDYDVKKGSLIIGHRDSRNTTSSASGAPYPPVPSHTSREIFTHIRTRMESTSPHEDLEKVLKNVVESVGRKYPSTALRTTVEELKRYVARHRQDHDPDEPCDFSDEMEIIVGALEKHLLQSVV